MASYVPPSRRPWYVNLAIVVIFASAAFTVLQWTENKINPQRFDLETTQKIQDYQELTKENLERTGKLESSAE